MKYEIGFIVSNEFMFLDLIVYEYSEILWVDNTGYTMVPNIYLVGI